MLINQAFYSSVLVYNASLVLVKISIVLMYRRIFVGVWMQRIILFFLVFLAAWGVTVVTSLSMLCLPIEKLWDPSVDGHCIDFVPAFFAPALINMITDFSIFIMPSKLVTPGHSYGVLRSVHQPLILQYLQFVICNFPFAKKSFCVLFCVWDCSLVSFLLYGFLLSMLLPHLQTQHGTILVQHFGHTSS